MFSTILTQELSYWFKRPAFYIYLVIFFLLATFLSAASAGIFDFLTVTTGSSAIVNSPISLNTLFVGMMEFIFFLFPSIIGVSIYRDFKSEMHTILYSYPFTKSNYLFAKFFSGIIIVTLIVLVVGVSFYIGFRLPGTNQDIVGDFNLQAYLFSYAIFMLPNILLFGIIVFGVVTFTRNIAAGFITIILLIFLRTLTSGLVSEEETRFLAALLDPYGDQAVRYYTRYWTLSEQNELMIPLKEVILYNRLLWLGIASGLFVLVFRYFSFTQNAFTLNFNKNKGERSTKRNFGGIVNVNLPKVTYSHTFKTHLQTLWKLSVIDFKYIVKSWPFISIVIVGLIFILIGLSEIGDLFGTARLPLTWRMLSGGAVFTLSINICTFLYAGMLVHRGNMARADHLIDVTPVPNWTLLGSKLLALIKMQLVLLSIIMLSGLIFQIYKGYYQFELGLYIQELFGLRLINYIIWALLSLCIQVLFRNPYLGLFVLLVISIGLPLLSLAGIEQNIFKYNQDSGLNYSDMNGYGTSITMYLVYKFYWLLAGMVLLITSALFWVRGVPTAFKDRFKLANQRFRGGTRIAFLLFLFGFLAVGMRIYYENNVNNTRLSSKQREELQVDWEKKYKKYENAPQPRVVSVQTHMNIYPESRDFKAKATYYMVNKTDDSIDSLFLNHNNLPSEFTFNKEVALVLKDTVHNFDIYQLTSPLLPGDSLQLVSKVENKPNTFLRNNSAVLSNGTFINNFNLFPTFGYSPGGELRDNQTRRKYGLPKNDLRPHPSDSTALGNTYISRDSDWIDFEATVSTSKDQIAIAPGYLQKEWVEGDRRYFHYKMDSKMLHFYAFNSARYEVKKEEWNGISLEIYYHKGHEFNLDRMMKGLKKSLSYNATNFSPYQHRQARIIEFPKSLGTFAQSFPNTIPFSEAIGFIADVDDSEEGGVDYPFSITAHEVAHQWWAHQVIGADVLGATMLSESLSEYASLKILEEQYGKEKMRIFLKKSLDGYLTQRTGERKRENALMYNDGQGFIRYQKGSLVFYAMSDYIGEENLNKALSAYVAKVKFQEPPYTTSIDMVNYIRAATPDSLKYLIKDMFEEVTLYENAMVDASYKALDNGTYEVRMEFNVGKYKNDEKGKKYYGTTVGDSIRYKNDKMSKPLLSSPLQDYIDVAIFGEEEVDGKVKEKILYYQKHKFTQINNTLTLIVHEQPKEVGIDPFNKLIDTQSNDNRRKLKQ